MTNAKASSIHYFTPGTTGEHSQGDCGAGKLRRHFGNVWLRYCEIANSYLHHLNKERALEVSRAQANIAESEADDSVSTDR